MVKPRSHANAVTLRIATSASSPPATFDPRTDECGAGQPPSCPQHPETILRLY